MRNLQPVSYTHLNISELIAKYGVESSLLYGGIDTVKGTAIGAIDVYKRQLMDLRQPARVHVHHPVRHVLARYRRAARLEVCLYAVEDVYKRQV